MSVRIASMEKKRKMKAKQKKSRSAHSLKVIGQFLVLSPAPSIRLEISPSMNEFVDLIHHAFFKYFKVNPSFLSDPHPRTFPIKKFPECVGYESVWITLSTQLINYAQLFLDYCQTTIPGLNSSLSLFPSVHC